MTRLSSKARDRLPRSDFALPKGTKVSKRPAFPIEDRTHELAAVRMVKRAEDAGHITAAQEREVVRKAERKLRGHIDGTSER